MSMWYHKFVVLVHYTYVGDMLVLQYALELSISVSYQSLEAPEPKEYYFES